MTTGLPPAATPADPDALGSTAEVDRAFLAIVAELITAEPIAEGPPDRAPRDRPDTDRTPPRARRAVGCAAGGRPGPGRRGTGPGPGTGRALGGRPVLPRERSP
uniref:hypothetical protein n=1 Tax=Pseudonocardia lacus TaxID=2835865 RepID=UPI001BDCF33F